MPENKRKRLLIIEEALKDVSGHWYEYNKAVRGYNVNHGVEVTILGHKEVSEKIQSELGVIPTFSRTNWDGIYSSKSALLRYFGILKHNYYIFQVIHKFLKENESFDCVFVPTVVIYHWIAWAILARKFNGKKFKRLVLFVRNNAGSYKTGSDVPVFQKHTHLLKLILKTLQGMIQEGIVLIGTDSSRHAREYKILSGLELRVFPHPMTHSCPARNERKKSNKIIFSCLGPARFEKGIDILEDAIVLYLRNSNDPNVHFILQWNNKILNPDGMIRKCNEQLDKDQRITYLTNHLSSEEYREYLNQTDCVLLPYRRESYFTRLSAPVIEAAMLGIPTIYTKDTWLEEAIHEYGAGLGCQDGDAFDLSIKIRTMALEIDRYKSLALINSKKAKLYHSEERFMQCLWSS